MRNELTTALLTAAAVLTAGTLNAQTPIEGQAVGDELQNPADEFSAENITLYAWMDQSVFDAGGGNDCWGYVSPSGREYAIVGLITATAFVEITDPYHPVVIHQQSHNSSTTGDMKVYGHYAYSIGDYYNLQVFDLSDIDNGVVTKVNELNYRAHNFALNEDSGFAYMSASSYSSGITALDLSDPINPTVAGATNPTGGHVHDTQVVSYTSGPYAGREIAFCPSGYASFDIIDVTDKANMVRLSTQTYSGLSYCHQGWLSEDMQYFYLNDELDELNGYEDTTRTLVWDVSDLSNPVYISDFTTGKPTTDHNLFVKDGFIYEANYESGVHIFDARENQTSPAHVGWFDTHPERDFVGYQNGAWTFYPYFPSGTAIATDRNRAFFILDPSPARGERSALDVTNLTAGQNATLSLTNGAPSETAYFAYSLAGYARTPVPQLGVNLDIDRPTLSGTAMADGSGAATLVRSVPLAAQGRTVYLQAAQQGRTSNVFEGVVN